ncbi:MAG TPA: MATE family efflux transporter [Candidatus Anaerostipes excrementavium]|uniref:Multidrug export protein MepA n=1 Tax=Candidatus Anaerostipes excrementavium TaxID=2838463 RepID=A0A9D2BA39_9FIRM|nr:MATE family efflux transporter [uncultured Anaerostipes sp.]HIX67902.1 MATE family efflux transporter [Candidatus Anaerostipes excrementavium]
MTEAERNPLAKEFHTLSLIKFAFPSMVMMVFMGLYTIMDTIFVARFVDTNALSSINIVCPVINIIVGLGTMLATGGSAIVAKKMGSGNTEEARSNFTLIIITGIITGLAITVIGLLFLDKIVWGLGASEILFPYCRDYLAIQLIFVIGNIMQVLYQNLFVTAGKPTLGLILSVLAGLANIVFDYIFIVLLHMGIQGAALGTGIGYMIPTVIGTIFFLTGRSELHFCKPKMDADVLLKSCSNGASEMVSQLSTAVTTFLFNATMMKLLGEDGVAAITVIIYSQFLLTTLYIGFSMGVAPIISYNYGSENVKQLKKVVRICFCFILVISVFVFLLSFFAGESIAKIFAENNENVFEITKNGFSIFSFGFLFSGCNIFASALFTALSNGKVSATISFLRTFGFILIFLLVLPRFLEVTGVWLAIPIAELLTLMLTIYLIFRHRKYYQYL